MAAVSEPPWLNKSAGTAARNGTNAHTINFGFTSAAGSLLVAITHSAATNSAVGWTKHAGPAGAGEAALMTKTSTGDSSIAVTHNASDYATNWLVYEFPAGSTLTGFDWTAGSSDALEPLNGLPGTEQVIIGILGRGTTGGESGGSIAPSAPWVEDADLFTAASGGFDGTYLAVVRQINVTATSITPVISPTYGGSWGAGAREKISVALDVAVAATAHTRTVDDPAGLTDAAASASAFARSATDGTGLVDATSRAHGKAITDGAGLVDTAARASGHVRIQTDGAGHTDTAVRATGFARAQTDGAGLVDAAIPILFTLIARAIDDAMGLVDGDLPQAVDVAEAVTDGAGWTDDVTPALTAGSTAHTRTITDGAGLLDSVSVQVAGAGTRLVDDALGLTDSARPALSAARPATDALGLTDSVSAQLSASTAHVRSVSDSMGLVSAHSRRRITRRPFRGTTSRYALVPD